MSPHEKFKTKLASLPTETSDEVKESLIKNRSSLLRLAGQTIFTQELKEISDKDLIQISAVTTILYHSFKRNCFSRKDASWIRDRIHRESVKRGLTKKSFKND